VEPSDPQTPTIRICVIVGDFLFMPDYLENIPNCFYRVSIKALVLDEQGRFLLCREDNGKWELPGGGLDF
jgi:8-oxo-dGTP pyrophosphatase MutT (NUDIX family)